MDKVHLSNCGKNYHNSWLFRNVNLELDCKIGNSYAVLGENGSGKSTLLLMLTGQVGPTEGLIRFSNDGRDISSDLTHNYYSHSSPSMELPEELSLVDWFKFQNKIKPFYKDFDLDKLCEICKFTSTTKTKSILNYSSGMKQRLKLVLSFYTDVPICLLDEPISNLDINGIKLFQMLIEEHVNNKTIIVASNRKDEYYFTKKRLLISHKEINEVK